MLPPFDICSLKYSSKFNKSDLVSVGGSPLLSWTDFVAKLKNGTLCKLALPKLLFYVGSEEPLQHRAYECYGVTYCALQCSLVLQAKMRIATPLLQPVLLISPRQVVSLYSAHPLTCQAMLINRYLLVHLSC